MASALGVWQVSCQDLELRLRTYSGQDHVRVTDLEAFQASVENLCKVYARQKVAILIRDRLTPHMQHLISFEKAISLSAQLETPSALLWSATLAVMQCACRFTAHLDKIVQALSTFYRALPNFTEYMKLFPDNKRLQYPLEDMFKDYGELCLHTLKWTSEKPMLHVLRNLVSSSLEQRLQTIMISMKMHKKDFENAAELAFRQHQMAIELPDTPPSSPVLGKVSPHTVTERQQLGFRGREEVLADIHSRFSRPKTTESAEAPSYLLHGMSGIGKTSTALEYTYRHRSDYDFVFWLVVGTTTDLVKSFAQLVAKLRALGLLGKSGTSGNVADIGVEQARDWLENTDHRWLLVFDNVEDWSSILRYWPTSSKAQSGILVTAQKQEFRRATTHSRLLEDLSPDECSDLLMSHVDRNSSDYGLELEASRKIAEMFGGLPLAIAHMQGYTNDAPCKLQVFYELAQHRWPSLWEAEVLGSGHRPLDVVWDIALNELPGNAKALLFETAFMDPDSIPEAPFLGDGEAHDREFRRRRAEFVEMRRCLVRRALISPIPKVSGSFMVHRALQRAILYKLDRDLSLRHQIFHKAIQDIRQLTPFASPIQMPDPAVWDRFGKAVSHVLALRAAYEQSQPPMQPSVEFAQLLYDAAFNTWERETTKDGLKLLLTALNVLNDLHYDDNGPLRANIHSILGVTCDNVGISKRQEALQHREIVIRARQKIVHESLIVTETDDILLHNALNDRAESRLQYYDYQEADRLVETCLRRYRTWGSESEYPFEYGKYYRNKATILMLQNRHEEAIRLARHAVELAELHGGTGTHYLMYLQTMASHLCQSGDTQGALAQFLEVFRLRESLCGRYHDVTLLIAYAVGAMHDQLGQTEQAEKWFRLTLQRAERHPWPEEPLCRTQYHLAQILKRRCRPCDDALKQEAAALESKAEEVLNRLLRYHCPDELRIAEDRMVLYDHLQPVFRGKWIGRGLLQHVSRLPTVR